MQPSDFGRELYRAAQQLHRGRTVAALVQQHTEQMQSVDIVRVVDEIGAIVAFGGGDVAIAMPLQDFFKDHCRKWS
jgi:hypothetical protein